MFSFLAITSIITGRAGMKKKAEPALRRVYPEIMIH
jgi:hypothetical protein